MSYFLDVFLFPKEHLALNASVLMWPSKIRPVFDENDEVKIFFNVHFFCNVSMLSVFTFIFRISMVTTF